MKAVGCLLICGFAAACGAKAQTFPVAPGQIRDGAEANLKSASFCRREGKEQDRQSYSRCSSLGVSEEETWFVLDYDEGVVRAVRKYWHMSSEQGARKRFAQLVEAHRSEFGADSSEARRILAEMGATPIGSITWSTWQSGDMLVGLYLLEGPKASDPHIMELRTPSAPTP